MSAPARAVAGMWGSWGGGRRRRDGGGAVDGEEALGIPVDTPLLYAVVPAAGTGSGGGDGRARGCCGGIDGVRRIVGRCALLLVALVTLGLAFFFMVRAPVMVLDDGKAIDGVSLDVDPLTGRIALTGRTTSVWLFNPNLYRLRVRADSLRMRLDALLERGAPPKELGSVSACAAGGEGGGAWIDLRPDSAAPTCFDINIDLVDLGTASELLKLCARAGDVDVMMKGSALVRFFAGVDVTVGVRAMATLECDGR